ncbi:MAG: phosphoenolpyruvate--protein phosphotransferase [bacterium]
MEKKKSVFKGIAASPGIAIGKAFVIEEESDYFPEATVQRSGVKDEILRFQTALSKTKNEMLQTQEKILKTLGKSHARLIEAYLLILSDPILTEDVIQTINREWVKAEYALKQSIDKIVKKFEKLDDEYFRERKNDVIDVGKKIMQNLLGRKKKDMTKLKDEVLIIAHSLSPSDTVHMRDQMVKAFATDIGGKTSHTAIVARILEIPAVVGLKAISKFIRSGDDVIIDGNAGLVIINPDRDTISSYRRAKEIHMAELRELEKLKDLPAQTVDGHRIVLAANIDSSDEVKSVLSHGAEGVGLFRTEFLFLDRNSLPTEEEQYRHYTNVVKSLLPYSVIIRTLDLGGDKLAKQGYGVGKQERNPFMGLRGIRLCLHHPELLKPQIRAILRASSEGKVKMMFPMISTLEELRQVQELVKEVKLELTRERIDFDGDIEIGIMIEVPSAALITDILAKESDFISIGTNDLIQYTLAVDRVNEDVATLYDPLNLSILRLIKFVVDSTHAAGKWVGMCGEMAADPNLNAVLLGLGLDELSISPVDVPRIKSFIRTSNFRKSQELVKEIMRLSDRDSISRVVKRGVARSNWK